ncbi:MAG: hypothetical protein ABWZ52_11745 [Acidimicrobiales bacterium]
MTSLVDQPRWRRRIGALVLAVTVTAGACSDDGGSDRAAPEDAGPNTLPPQTLPGGVELAAVDPLRLLAGEGLAYGQPLPSEQAAANAYLEDPEVASVMARRLYSRVDGRRMGDVLALELNGAEIFDASVLDAFVGGAVGGLGDGTTDVVTIAGRPVVRSQGPSGTVMGYREGNQLMLVRGPAPEDIGGVVERQLQALASGAVGAAEPFTPLVPLPIDAAFVPVPTVSFQPIPPPAEETPPERPGLPGATGVQGRYGVVAGERRTKVWAHTLDPATYPSAERLEPALAALVSARAGGAPVEASEVLGRVVLSADGPDGSRSVRAFRHEGLALVVEGQVPAQLDAVITAWLTELA